jgi:hypothetical protein
MFCAEPIKSIVEGTADRFLRYEEEEKKRDVMGLSMKAPGNNRNDSYVKDSIG